MLHSVPPKSWSLLSPPSVKLPSLPVASGNLTVILETRAFFLKMIAWFGSPGCSAPLERGTLSLCLWAYRLFFQTSTVPTVFPFVSTEIRPRGDSSRLNASQRIVYSVNLPLQLFSNHPPQSTRSFTNVFMIQNCLTIQFCFTTFSLKDSC